MSDFNLQTIYGVMDSLAEQGYVFSNEQDFQFTFANELKKLPMVNEVKLEALSLSVSWEDAVSLSNGKWNQSQQNSSKIISKQYTDIIVKTIDEEYFAIELKFKTPNKICTYETEKSGRIVTMVQCAYDINAYEYLYDVQRLELINSRFFYKDIKIKKGYAIILTNESHYRYYDFAKTKIWKKYCLKDGTNIQPGPLTFSNGSMKYVTKGKVYEALKLHGDYSLHWRNYYINKYIDFEDKNKSCHPGFSYLALEVLPKDS